MGQLGGSRFRFDVSPLYFAILETDVADGGSATSRAAMLGIISSWRLTSFMLTGAF